MTGWARPRRSARRVGIGMVAPSAPGGPEASPTLQFAERNRKPGGGPTAGIRALRRYDAVHRLAWVESLGEEASPRGAILGAFEGAISAVLESGSRDGCLLVNTALELAPHDPEIADIGGDRYKTSPHFTDAERALLDLTVRIGIDANRVGEELWKRLHEHFTEPQMVEAVFTITTYIAVSKFGDALGVELEPVFSGIKPLLRVSH